MKFAFTITLGLLITINTIAQTFVTQARPFDKKEWGYMNQKGEFIIEAKYRKCYKFSEGYAPIYEDKKFFFINLKGEKLPTEIEDYKLSNAFGFGLLGFSDGLVPVLVSKKWGYMNTDGKLAIELKYDKASKFDNGFATVKKEDTFYVINKKGAEFKVDDPEIAVVKHFSEGLAPYNTKDKKNGFIGPDGKVVIKAQFASVGYFSNGLAWAKTMDKKVGFINKKGEWVIHPTFVSAKNFNLKSNLARIKDAGGKWAYTTKAGKVIYVDTEVFGDFKDAFLAKGKKHGKVGYYNQDGKWVIEPTFDGGRNFKNGFAAAKKEDKWGFINENGEWVIEPTLGGVKDLELVE